MAGRTTPPERIEVGGDGRRGPLVIRRLLPDDAPAVARAIDECFDHLRPFLPWATPANVTAESQRRRLESPELAWTADAEHWGYGVFAAAEGAPLVASCGLHKRRGPGTLEVGYWVHAAHLRRGIATAAARAMTDAGFAVAGVEAMEILCDVANHASAAVARRVGYRLAGTIEHAAEAPSETGQRFVFTVTRAEWRATHH
jgi:RimJ/RimL family protein N-acetyltransferase